MHYREGTIDANPIVINIAWKEVDGSFVMPSAATPMPVTVISGGGAGTQYTEGDTDASITGTVMMMEGAANALVPAQGTVADGLLVNLGANNDVTVAGVSTSAKQDTIIGHLDGVEGLLTTLAGAVSGTEVQVDVLTMPSVTVTATNLDIRDIDKASDDILIYANTVKDGSGTSYVPLVDTDGHLQIDVLSSALPTGASTSANQTTIIGHLDGVEGLLTTIDADTGSILLAVDGIEALLTTIDADTSVLAGTDFMLGTDFSNVFGTSSLLITTQADDIANTQDTIAVTSFLQLFDGTTWDRARGDATNGLLVNLGSNNDVTVTGTVDLGATDNAVLDAIAASVAAIDTDTTTIIGHVDGIEGLLTTIDADTSGIITSVQLIDDIVLVEDAGHTTGDKGVMSLAVRNDAGTTLAGTDLDYAPLSLDANGALRVTGGGGGTEYVVDADAPDTPTGTTLVMERDDALSALTPIEGDWVHTRANANGALWVAVNGTVTIAGAVTNAGTFAVQVDGAALTALQLIDDIVYAEDSAHASTNKGAFVLAVRNDAGTSLVGTDGDYAPFSLDANGALRVTGGGGGTEYVVDADAPDTPTGTTLVMERDDALAALTPIEGDWVHTRANANGALWVAVNGSVAVTGTVDLGATDNAVLDAIAASVAAIDTDTTTIIGHVDGIEGLLTTIDADTGSILTSVQLIDDAIFAEDVAAQAADKGIAILAVRRDADTSLVGTDNDYANLQVDANGYLKVEIFDGGGSHTVDGTVTAELSATDNAVLDAIAASVAAIDTDTTTIIGHVDGIEGLLTTIDADTGSILTSVQLIDDAIFAEDVAAQAADKGIAILAVRRDADTSLVGTDNDYANLQVDANGYLKVEIFDGGGSHTVDGTVTANLAAGTNNIGDVDILSIAAGDNNIGNVDIVSLPASTNTIEVVGDVADDVAASGNPVLGASVVKNFDGTAPGDVSAENDAGYNVADNNRRVYVNTTHPNYWSYHLDTSTAQTDTEVKAAPGANLALFVTDIIFSSGSATAINLFFEEGASKVLGPYYLEAVAGRGMALHFTTPKKITANTALTLTTSASIAHCVDVIGFTADVA